MVKSNISIIRPSTFLIASGIVLLIGAIVWRFPLVHAESHQMLAGEKVLTIHDGNQKRGFYTKASTLRQALQDAGVRIDTNDRTEPELDTVLEAPSYEVNVYRARPVVIRDGVADTTIMTA